MRIGIYGGLFLTPKTGVGKYVFNLCKHLKKELPQAKFFLFSNKALHFKDFENFEHVIEPFPVFQKIPSTLWLRFFSARLIEQKKIDIFWSGLPIVPQSGKFKKVGTLYDLTPYLAPFTMRWRTLIAYRLLLKKCLCECDAVFAISEGTKKKGEELLGLKIDEVIYPGVDLDIYYPRSYEEVKKYKSKKGLPEKYILTIATLEPRKNLLSLLKAYKSLKGEGYLKNIFLVLTGYIGWKNRKILKELSHSDVIYLGYVPEEELPFLYSGAEVFVFPSIYEGFGMPVQEARACGCPVIATDIPEIREAGGENAIYISSDEFSIKNALFEFFENPKIESICKPKEYLFEWRKEAIKLAHLFLRISG